MDDASATTVAYDRYIKRAIEWGIRDDDRARRMTIADPTCPPYRAALASPAHCDPSGFESNEALPTASTPGTSWVRAWVPEWRSITPEGSIQAALDGLRRRGADYSSGFGNGQTYTGFVYVVGPDVYGLAHEGDGSGCEND